MTRFLLNNTLINTDLPEGMVLVDFIRYQCHLAGTKIGCREGDCGACTVLVGELLEDTLSYHSVTCCLMPLANAQGKHIVTVEGINMKEPNPVQQAMCDEGATQCGFCTPGIVMSLMGSCLKRVTAPGPLHQDQLLAAVDGNICRCTGYKSIERAASRVRDLINAIPGPDPVAYLIMKGFLPAYFLTTRERLIQLKDDLQKNGVNREVPNATFLAGGTDLYVQQPETLLHQSSQYLLNRSALKGISKKDNRCILGAAATVGDMLASPVFREYFPELPRYIKLVSSTPIRNMATIAGNFINASPIGDLTIFFLSLHAHIILADDHSTRELALEDLYLGYKSLAKKPGEYIRQVWFTLPGKNSYFNFEKVSKRTHLDIASVNTAMLITLEDDVITHARLSAGGVSAIPMVLRQASAFLQGKKLTTLTIIQAIEKAEAEVAPISDVRGTATYKRFLLKQLIKAHFITLFPFLEVEELLYA